MLTDDDLVRELAAGFREETAGLRYAGRVPAPPRRVVPWTAVPVAAAAAVVLVLPQLGGPGGPSAGPQRPGATAGPASPGRATPPGGATTAPAPALVTDTIELAGFTFRYRHAPGTPTPELFLALGAEPPADATPVDGLDSEAAAWVTRAWVGTDPLSGDAALWVQSPGAGIGAHVMFWSPDLTTDDLARMLRTGSTAEDLG